MVKNKLNNNAKQTSKTFKNTVKKENKPDVFFATKEACALRDFTNDLGWVLMRFMISTSQFHDVF